MTIIDTVKDLPITKTFYSLKESGKPPKIKVRIVDGKPKAAILKVSEVDYYFHNTKGYSIEQDGEWFTIPFDGWDVSLV